MLADVLDDGRAQPTDFNDREAVRTTRRSKNGFIIIDLFVSVLFSFNHIMCFKMVCL